MDENPLMAFYDLGYKYGRRDGLAAGIACALFIEATVAAIVMLVVRSV